MDFCGEQPLVQPIRLEVKRQHDPPTHTDRHTREHTQSLYTHIPHTTHTHTHAAATATCGISLAPTSPCLRAARQVVPSVFGSIPLAWAVSLQVKEKRAAGLKLMVISRGGSGSKPTCLHLVLSCLHSLPCTRPLALDVCYCCCVMLAGDAKTMAVGLKWCRQRCRRNRVG